MPTVLPLPTNDRTSVAMDLHDLALQPLFAAALTLESLRGQLSEVGARRLDGAIDNLDTTITELRTAIAVLTDGPHRSTHLDDAIDSVLEAATRALGCSPRVTLRGVESTSMSPVLVRNVVAVLNEALSNAARHADATEVTVSVTVDAGQVCVQVADNGRGFVPLASGSGLANLAVRARRCGGTFDVRSTPGEGTVLHWTARLGR